MPRACGGRPFIVNVDYRQGVRPLTTNEAAQRLGVKVETLYAYVSRGTLSSYRAPDGRTSHFDAAEVEALARRGRPRRTSLGPTLEIRVETAITQIDDHHLRFRGHDAIGLSARWTFEEVATLLWTGALARQTTPWAGDVLALPGVARPLDRIRIAVALAGARSGPTAPPGAPPVAPTLSLVDPAHLIATMVDSQPLAGEGRTPRLHLPDRAPLRATIAGRLWTRLSPRRPAPGQLMVLNTALVLLADHELAASTLAARVAASAHAGLPAVVGAGLGPLDGPLHGRASTLTRALLDDAVARGAAAAVGDVLQRHERLPGFGQPLYPRGDPRAVAVLGALRAATNPPHPMRVVDDVIEAARDRVGVEPNVDYALAALGLVTAMPLDAGELIFAVARTAGWAAHAQEEWDAPPLRFRARAVYIGPLPATAHHARPKT
jgi:citrate synthase